MQLGMYDNAAEIFIEKKEYGKLADCYLRANHWVKLFDLLYKHRRQISVIASKDIAF